MKKGFVGLLLSLALVCCILVCPGCDPACDGTRREISMDIVFNHPKDYTSVYGLKKGIQNIPASSLGIWTVPLSLLEDQTTIIFKSASRTDTLTIHYTRDVKLRSVKCGFEVFMDDYTIASPTSFQQSSLQDNDYNNVLVTIND